MSRVQLVTPEQAPLAVRGYFAVGSPGVIGAALANVPELMEAAMPLISRALSPLSLGARLKEIVIVRTSALQACRYCTLTHAAIALRSDLSVDEVRVLRDSAPGEATRTFHDPAEAALLTWTDVVACGPEPVTDALHGSLAGHFSDAQIVELTMALTVTLLLNRFCTALDLPVSEGSIATLRDAGLLDEDLAFA